MEFNASQERAVFHKDGPMLVLAGPGSGKTLVITHRTKHLIEEYGVNPNNILVITFTKAAASEMKERFNSLMGNNYQGVNFGTFHGIFFTILKYAYGFNGSNILREEQKNQFYREIIGNMELEIEDEKEFISGIASEISLVKGEMLDINYYYSKNCSEEIFKRIYEAYDSRLRQGNLIDFDDMLVMCYELLTKRKDILSIWQNKFEYILIDEFQDINKVQYDIIRLLSKPQENIFIVGDDDQSIYRFRGAKPEIMLNFEKDYPNALKVILDINYRSTSNIINAAGKIIKNNRQRFSKNITAVNLEGDKVEILTYKDLREENNAVIENIRAYRNKDIPFSEMAVLFRTNTQPRALIEKLMEYNIPFRMRDSLPNIYEHWIAGNIISYIKIAMGMRDRGLFLQIINRPKRYISREALADQNVDFNKLREFYVGKPWVIERIDKLEYDINVISKMSPYALINYLRKGMGYEEYLEEYSKFRRIKVEELLDTLNEIQESSKEFDTYEEWFLHIENYKKELEQQFKNKDNKDIDSVAMATMHSAKGLEYRVVFVIDANESITPHQKAVLEEDLEEERRMFYVAVTRAKERLHIYSVKERYGKELLISRFVGEIFLDEAELIEGTIIEHKMYGRGTIRKREKDTLIIYFERIKKERTLNLDFCISNRLLKIIN